MLNDPLLLSCTRLDLELEWLEDQIEGYAELEELKPEDVTFEMLFPGDYTDSDNTIEAIMFKILERDPNMDPDQALIEAKAEVRRRLETKF